MVVWKNISNEGKGARLTFEEAQKLMGEMLFNECAGQHGRITIERQ